METGSIRSRHLRPRDGAEQRTTAFELFFDLVYVFAVTQLSHLVIDGDLRFAAIGKAAFLLVVVWSAWIYTTWMANSPAWRCWRARRRIWNRRFVRCGDPLDSRHWSRQPRRRQSDEH